MGAMPLVTCSDCSASISSRAAACPQCGCPGERGLAGRTLSRRPWFGMALCFLALMPLAGNGGYGGLIPVLFLIALVALGCGVRSARRAGLSQALE